MTVIAYRYRAYPNAGQRELLARHFGCKRKVFNLYLEEAHRLFKKDGSILSAYTFIKKLPALKRSPELTLDAKISFRDKSLYWSHGKCDTLKNSKTTLFPAF